MTGDFDRGFGLGVVFMMLTVVLVMVILDAATPNELCVERGFTNEVYYSTEVVGEQLSWYCVRGSSEEDDAEIWPIEFVENYCTNDGVCNIERWQRDRRR